MALLALPLVAAACGGAGGELTVEVRQLGEVRVAPTLPPAWSPTPSRQSAADRTPQPMMATASASPTSPIQPTGAATLQPGGLTPWLPYRSERNHISLAHPATLSVIEAPDVVQFGNGVVILEGGPLYIGVTALHFLPYEAQYMPAGFLRQDAGASLQSVTDLCFSGGWEDETTQAIEPRPMTVDGYPAAWSELRRQTEADARTGRPVDDSYLFAVILGGREWVRVQVLSHDEIGADLLPYYGELLLASVSFE